MTVQDIAKDVLNNKADKDPEDDIPDEEEEEEDPASPSTAHFPCHADGLHPHHERWLVLLYRGHF